MTEPIDYTPCGQCGLVAAPLSIVATGEPGGPMGWPREMLCGSCRQWYTAPRTAVLPSTSSTGCSRCCATVPAPAEAVSARCLGCGSIVAGPAAA